METPGIVWRGGRGRHVRRGNEIERDGILLVWGSLCGRSVKGKEPKQKKKGPGRRTGTTVRQGGLT